MKLRTLIAPSLIPVMALIASSAACRRSPEPPPVAPAPPSTPVATTPPVVGVAPDPQTVAQNKATVEAASKAARARISAMTFEQYKATVYKEPFEGGGYIVNGDTLIANEKLLREFYESLKTLDTTPNTSTLTPPTTTALTVALTGALDAVWNATDKLHLTYCVSNSFGARHANVVAQMEAASRVWEESARVDLIHDATQDPSCTAANTNVVFDVRPVDVDGEYLARAFFPNEGRAQRNVLIDDTAFELVAPPAKLQLDGILRHELGHTLGFRHEHTRPEAGDCFEDSEFRILTSYDAFSVMHYPQCNGRGDWGLVLTDRDRNGAACLYGPAAGFTIDPSICRPRPQDDVPAGTATVASFPAQSLAVHEEKQYGPFAVAPGTIFEASIGNGTGDPDLYVRYRREPTQTKYNCRPFRIGSTERCAIDVPATETKAFVMVRGYTAGTYDLTVRHTPVAQ